MTCSSWPLVSEKSDKASALQNSADDHLEGHRLLVVAVPHFRGDALPREGTGYEAIGTLMLGNELVAGLEKIERTALRKACATSRLRVGARPLMQCG